MHHGFCFVGGEALVHVLHWQLEGMTDSPRQLLGAFGLSANFAVHSVRQPHDQQRYFPLVNKLPQLSKVVLEGGAVDSGESGGNQSGAIAPRYPNPPMARAEITGTVLLSTP
jgi:hypothetical protein